MQPSPFHFMRNTRFHAGCLVCAFTALAMSAPAQFGPWFQGSSSPDTFGGNPDSSGFIRIPPDTDDWTRHLRIGAMVGMNINANFNEKGLFNIPGNNAANGVYNDGYVHPSGNAFGTTTDWGYDNASQYNAATHTLQMAGTTSYSTSGNSKDDGGAFPGLDVAYGDNLWYWKHARVGWELGFGLLPINITDNQPMSGQINQNVYSFSTGTIKSLPPPGYPGASSSSAPAIFSTAISTNQTSSLGTINGSHTLDVMLYTLRLGPSFYWDLCDYAGISLGAGPAVGLVSGDYKYDEIITAGGSSARNSGSFGATDLTYGGYVNGTLMIHVVANGDIYMGAQFMPMEDASFSNGGREGQLNLGGQLYFSIGVNWPF
jgi:hypothetical protein